MRIRIFHPDADADPDPDMTFHLMRFRSGSCFLCGSGSGQRGNFIRFLKSYKILISSHETVYADPDPHFPLIRIRIWIFI
jgi:hypothetical protein